MPAGTVTADSVSVSLICMPETSCVIESGMSPGSASMLTSRVSWESTPPSIDARGVVGAEQLEHDRRVDRLVHVHAEEVHVDDLAAHRVALEVLDEHRRGRAAVDADVEDRAGVGERVAQDARVDGEVRRLAVAAVDDAGHLARAAQPAGGTRALGVAGVEGKLRGVGHDLVVAAGRGTRRDERPSMVANLRLDSARTGYSLSNVLRRGAACDLRRSPPRGPRTWRRAVPDVPSFRRRVVVDPGR